MVKFRNAAPAVGAEHLCTWPLMHPNPSPSSSLFRPLLTVWRVGMPLPGFTETEWASDYLTPYLLGGSLLLSHEKPLCSERDHRLRHYMLNPYLKYMRHQCNVPWLSVPRYSTRHVQAQYPVMGNQSEKHATCCQHLPRKFLFLPAVRGSDSQPVSDGCQIIGNCDKAFTYPAGKAWKRIDIAVGSSCLYVCDEEAHRKIFTQFLCLALFNLPPDVPAML